MLVTERPRRRAGTAEISSLEARIATCCRRCGCSPCGCRPGGAPLPFDAIEAELTEEGYVAHLHPIDRGAVRAMRCGRCHGPMGYRGFRLVEDELVLGYRAFAVCPGCRRWMEF